MAEVVRRRPDDPVARANLGVALCDLGRRLEGIGQLRQAGESWLAATVSANALDRALDMVTRLQSAGDFDGALALVRRAVAVAPGAVRAHQLHAVTCGQINLTDEALAAGESALALAPDHAMMRVLQASLEADAGRLEDAERRLDGLLRAPLPDREAFRALKEMARVADGLGRGEAVFPHLAAAARVADRLPEWRAQDRRLIPAVIAANTGAFTAQNLARWSGAGLPGAGRTHVFVVGFFRSGTTLIQQILATHPKVFLADESNLVWEVQRALRAAGPPGEPLAARVARLDAAEVARLRKVYWDAARARWGEAIDRPVFVDKFTLNTLDIGLINTLFPEAKVIFAQRDPRDVCLSAHLQLMTPSPATAHLLTWEGTARLYAATLAWWAHIRPRLSLQVLDLRYEAVIADFEAACRPMFGFLGLAWTDAARDFHTGAAGRFIASPSRNQVSRPLYATSVGRWRRHASQFAAVDGMLAPAVEALGYLR